MRYPQGPSESAELLRLALPLMTRHGTGYHPVSYAIWYEYSSGTNPLLKERVDATVEAGTPFSDEHTYTLYRECILDIWGAKALEVNAGLRNLIDDFSASTDGVTGQVRAFDNSLAGFADALTAEVPIDSAKRDALLAESLDLRAGLGSLQDELVSSQSEIRRLQADLQKLHHEALTDPLTGLYNRRGLDFAFQRHFEQSGVVSDDCSVVLLDIDHFKKVNDTFGHLFGDQVIRGVAGTLRTHAREQDLVARFGGEEFVLILPDTSAREAQANAERLRAHIERSVIRRREGKDAVARITVSAGVTGFSHGDTLQTLLDRADRALYSAKHQGRNQVQVLAPA